MKAAPQVQVYVILRADAYEEGESTVEHVTVKKVVQDEARARREVDRLNALNAEKGSRYYFETARLDGQREIEP
jgi:hypothetical protein